MVFKATWHQLKEQEAIDPHFGKGKLIYPIARFQPTQEGWQDALIYIKYKDGQ